MIFNSMFIQNDAIGSAMQAAVVRNDVISNNIANADVPGYKKKTVRFENYLSAELKSSGSIRASRLSQIKPTIHVEHGGYEYRLDGNNVDVEAEMVALYQNSVKYDALATGLMNNYERLNLVLNGIK